MINSNIFYKVPAMNNTSSDHKLFVFSHFVFSQLLSYWSLNSGP
jgi:hypothetical protein